MKRRILSTIRSRQDVCLFCSLRATRLGPTFNRDPSDTARSYSISAAASAAAGVATAPREDDDDPPMLRQNAELLNAFPSRKQTSQPPSPPSSSTNFQPQTRRRDSRLAQSEGRPSNGSASFRSFRPSNDSETNQLNPSEPRYNTKEDFRNVRGGRNQRNTDRQGLRVRRDPPDVQHVRNKPRPGDDFRRVQLTKDHSEGTHGVQNGVSGKEGLNGKWSIGRRENSRPSNVQPKTPSRPAGYRDKTEDRMNKAKDGLVQSATVNDSSNAEDISVPVTTSLDNDERTDGFHPRRGGREDKRKPRSARFEDEDGDSIDAPTPTPTRRMDGYRRHNALDFDMAEAEEALYGDRDSRKKRKKKDAKSRRDLEQIKPSVRIAEFMSVSQLAKALGVQLESFISKLEEEGYEGARHDHVLDAQTSAMFADLHGFEPIIAEAEATMDLTARPPPEDGSSLPPRPPIVTIMGHVDHGKTTILDYLRKSSVVATEHGGITQHIGAFSVTMPGSNRQITFLDTPGHAAFLEMRRRGANVTDIVVLVVAADDSVKPQTIEAIKHAIEAKVQIIVAINKVDKEDSNIERVKQDLTRHEIVVEDYGGDFQAIAVSGKTGQGMAELEEAIITLADVHDYRAENDGPAEGTIIESKVTAGGRVATVLVRRGTLRPGDYIVAGPTWARVRTLKNDNGVLVNEAPPGTPVQVDGWRGEDPTAGLEVLQAADEDQAKDAVDYRIEQREINRASTDMAAINEARTEEAEARAKVLAWESQQDWASKRHGARPKDNTGWVEPAGADGPQQVHFVVKADVAGSVEAVVAAVTAVGNNEIVANVIHSGTGQVTESDIRMLATSGDTGYAISFNQPVEGTVARLAETAGLQILDHNIIYKVTDVVKEKLAEKLPPIVTQKVLGEADIGQIFEVSVKKNKVKIAGCKVTNGTISRANKIRVQRNGKEVYSGTLHSLKNVKKDVTEMRKGTECGMGFENWEDFQEGDQVQCYEEHEERRVLY